MDCPYCGDRLRYVGYSTKERDNVWWCPGCGEDVYHIEVQAIMAADLRKMRAALAEKLDANRDEEGGAD